MAEKIFISRFTVPEIGTDLALDWYSVVGMQRQKFHVDIHLNTGVVLVVTAPSAEINQANFESLYEHWGRAITS